MVFLWMFLKIWKESLDSLNKILKWKKRCARA
jgi:hypothetical protein